VPAYKGYFPVIRSTRQAEEDALPAFLAEAEDGARL
jgi:hypothetical protein